MKGCTEVSCSQVSDPHPVVITHIAHTMALQGSPSDPRARAKGPLHRFMSSASREQPCQVASGALPRSKSIVPMGGS
jgi:hypothetical protein